MPHFNYEKRAYQKYSLVGGGDEVGRGSLAGPVVASIVILNPSKIDERINDSKKLSSKTREELSDLIKSSCLSCSYGIVSPKEIDNINIYQGTKLAFQRAYTSMEMKPDYLLLDAMEVEGIPIPQMSLIKGDTHSYSIAAASILAKVYRDKMMVNYDKKYFEYGFNKNKGYGTKFHFKSIEKHGPCDIHRLSFKPFALAKK